MFNLATSMLDLETSMFTVTHPRDMQLEQSHGAQCFQSQEGVGVGGTATALATTTAIKWYGNASQTAKTAQIHSWLPLATHSHGLLNTHHVVSLGANKSSPPRQTIPSPGRTTEGLTQQPRNQSLAKKLMRPRSEQHPNTTSRTSPSIGASPRTSLMIGWCLDLEP